MRLTIIIFTLLILSIFSLLLSDSSSAQQVAYAWADKTTSASYTPSGKYSYNHSGGINISRNKTGSYAVKFIGFGGGGRGGNVQVTAYGPSRNTCHVINWNYNSGGADFVVNISCFSLSGQPVDSMYTVLVTK